MTQYEPVIGLEIHVQLTTNSKMFCSCANIFGDVPPNSAICPICLGYPGTLPVANKTAIDWARKVGAALNCELATHSKFDRKHYFYPDLPKGYQISQYDQPFSRQGWLALTHNGEVRKIGINRVHLEEDAAKNIHDPSTSSTLIDFNRAGTPLLEIVTEPDFRSPVETKAFLQDLQTIMRALGVSTADMEKGQMRCDANISLRLAGSEKLNPKTEIKNLNSFRNVERALNFEIKRQTEEHAAGRIPTGATRGFNADRGTTAEQRTKEEAADYRYFPEPDLPPFVFTKEENRQVLVDLTELPPQKRERLQRQYSMNVEQATLLSEQPLLASFLENTASELEQLDKEQVSVLPKEVPKLFKSATNLALRHLKPLIEKDRLTYETLKITPENFAEVVVLLQQGRLNRNALDQVLVEMQRTGGDPDAILQNLGVEQVSGEEHHEQYVQDVINGNPDIVSKITAGKDTAIQFLVGQVMAKTRGAGNPQVIRAMLTKHLRG
jgi:aspartyl-tRNA(Asn)/glutamyl-tRNA(Gln) amidotransferase subunit B